jgi:large subunit ribosomal protein L23
MNLYSIIKKPLITEKTTLAKDSLNVVAFVVDRNANKLQIRDAVTSIFNVEVTNVRTSLVAGKVKRTGRFIGKRSNWKKAYVTLKSGATIDFFEV